MNKIAGKKIRPNKDALNKALLHRFFKLGSLHFLLVFLNLNISKSVANKKKQLTETLSAMIGQRPSALKIDRALLFLDPKLRTCRPWSF